MVYFCPDWEKQLRKTFGNVRSNGHIAWRSKTHKTRYTKPATLDDIICYIKEFLLLP